jgi:hypothetical protein
MKPSDHSKNGSAPLASRIMEKVAREQMEGPFGKLSRYALKHHWSITVPDRRENKSTPFATGTERMAEKIEKKPARTKTLFRRLLACLKRVLK